MKIISKIDIAKERDNFLKSCSPPSYGYLGRVFDDYPYWYEVSVNFDDFNELLIGGSPLNPDSGVYSLAKAIDEISENRHLLNQKQKGVNTKHVAGYYKKFKKDKAKSLGNIFIIQRDFFSKDDLYIIDGMHRLLALGLYLKDGVKFNNFNAYLGWNEELK